MNSDTRLYVDKLTESGFDARILYKDGDFFHNMVIKVYLEVAALK